MSDRTDNPSATPTRATRGLFARALSLVLRTCAVCVIGLALLVGVFRLALPFAPSYHAQIERWAGEALDVRVILSEVDARWPLLSGPELVFEDAALWAPDGEALLLSAERGSVALDLMELLTHFAIKPGKVVLQGVVIDVEHRTEEGGWQVLGRAVAPAKVPARQKVAQVRPRGAQALPRGRLEIEDATIVVTDDRNDPEAGPTRIGGVHLDFAHERGFLFLEGALQGPGEGGEVSFSVEGRELGSAASDGRWQFFLSGTRVDLGAIGATVGLAPTALYGFGSLTLWASRNRGRIEQASLTLDLDDLLLASAGEHAVQYDRLAGRFNLAAQDDGWALLGRNVEVARAGHRWPQSSFSIELDAAGLHAARADYLRVEDLLPLGRLALSLDPIERSSTLPAQLLALEPHGELSALRFERETPDGPMLACDFAKLAAKTGDGRVSVSGLGGTLNVHGENGTLDLDADALVIEAPQHLREAMPAMDARGTVSWSTLADGERRVTVPDLSLASVAFQAQGTVEVRLPPPSAEGDAVAKGAHLDLQLALADADLAMFRRYVPVLKLRPGVGGWLEKSLVSGTMPRASVAFTGPLSSFPFDEGEGEFLVRAQVQDLELDYAGGFPRAEGINGVVALDNMRLDAEGFAGSTRGNSLRTLELTIADVREGILEYQGRTRGSLSSVIDFLRNSPYARHVAPLETVQGRGEVALNFTLPLRKREDAKLAAELDAEEGYVKLEGLPMALEQVTGTLRYDNADGLAGEGIEAAVLGEPVGIRLIPLYDQGGKVVTSQLEVRGAFDVASAVGEISPDLAGTLSGRTEFLASLRLPIANDEIRSLVIESDLIGAHLALPAPLAKAPEQSLPSSVVISHAQSGEASLALSLGQVLRARMDGALRDEQLTIERGALVFGGEAPQLTKGGGLTVTGELDELDLSGWGTVVARLGAGSSSTLEGGQTQATPALPALTALALQIGRLSMAGQTLTDLSVALRSTEEQQWALDLRSEDVDGAVFLPAQGDAGPLVARFTKFHLPPPSPEAPMSAMEVVVDQVPPDTGEAGTGAAPAPRLDPRNLPTLVLEIDDFAWQRLALGRVALELLAVESGVRLPHLSIESDSYRLDGKGEWLVSEGGEEHSSLMLAIRSSDLLKTLEGLGFAGSMSATAASLDADFSWEGAPRLVLDDALSGEIRVGIESGQLLNVRPGAGKVFGLMSVAALPRRLELDFRDVFDKGLGFDEISGTFTIANGDAYTEDLKLLGQTADVRISGRTGLVSRDYDQKAVVLANVGSPLPVAGALAGGPVVGAALLILSELMKEPLKGLSRTEYRITGPWAEPTVQRVALPTPREAPTDDAQVLPPADAPTGH